MARVPCTTTIPPRDWSPSRRPARRVLSQIHPLPPIELPLTDAYGCVAAADIKAADRPPRVRLQRHGRLRGPRRRRGERGPRVARGAQGRRARDDRAPARTRPSAWARRCRSPPARRSRAAPTRSSRSRTPSCPTTISCALVRGGRRGAPRPAAGRGRPGGRGARAGGQAPRRSGARPARERRRAASARASATPRDRALDRRRAGCPDRDADVRPGARRERLHARSGRCARSARSPCSPGSCATTPRR